jgi:hypothetical protein
MQARKRLAKTALSERKHVWKCATPFFLYATPIFLYGLMDHVNMILCHFLCWDEVRGGLLRNRLSPQSSELWFGFLGPKKKESFSTVNFLGYESKPDQQRGVSILITMLFPNSERYRDWAK